MRILAERGILNQAKILSLFLPCTSCTCLFVFYLKQVFLTASMQVNCSLCMKFCRKAKNKHTYNFVYVFVCVCMCERDRESVCMCACVVEPYCKDGWKPKLYYTITNKLNQRRRIYFWRISDTLNSTYITKYFQCAVQLSIYITEITQKTQHFRT
jgi:hypothetical protein